MPVLCTYSSLSYDSYYHHTQPHTPIIRSQVRALPYHYSTPDHCCPATLPDGRVPEVFLEVQLSTGRTAATSSGALLWSRGGGCQVLLYHATCIVYHGFKGSFHVLPTPFPRLVTNHPYSRSSALTRFLYGSLHFHISPHTTTCSAAASSVGPQCLLGLFTDIRMWFSSVWWCLLHPPFIRWTSHTPPPSTPSTLQEDTHTHTQVTPIPSHK